MNKVPRWVSVMWVTKLLISPVKKRIFCPKTTKFGPKLAFLSTAGSFGAQLVGWLVVVGRAVSRKTPIHFMDIFLKFWREKNIYIFESMSQNMTLGGV